MPMYMNDEYLSPLPDIGGGRGRGDQAARQRQQQRDHERGEDRRSDRVRPESRYRQQLQRREDPEEVRGNR